jgi:hypothetical protein
MSDSDLKMISASLEMFKRAINDHDARNPGHTSYGIGLAHFDMQRLGFDDGEELWPVIRIECDGKTTGNFRVLCDGQHELEREQEEQETQEVRSEDLVSV